MARYRRKGSNVELHPMFRWIRGKMGRTGPGGLLPRQGHDGQNTKTDVITCADVCHICQHKHVILSGAKDLGLHPEIAYVKEILTCMPRQTGYVRRKCLRYPPQNDRISD